MSKRAAVVSVVTAVFLSMLIPFAAPAQAATLTGRGLLARLVVTAERGASTYNRAVQFGGWSDANGDCQNTRAEVLAAESRVPVTYFPGGCFVERGKWFSTYDGAFRTHVSDVDVDHRVALAEAWVSGARSWSSTDRRRFTNDLGWAGSLETVTHEANKAKTAHDPAEWLPPLASNRCTYVLKWIQVKYRWRLTVDSTEKAAMLNVLQGACRKRQITIPPRAR